MTVDTGLIGGKGGRVTAAQGALIALVCFAIAACEYIFAYQSPAYGIGIGLGLVIVLYIMLSTLNLDPRIIMATESLALIPLYILFTSSLPWFFIDQQYLLPAVYSCILGLCFWHMYRNHIGLKGLLNIKRKTVLKYVLIGAAIGIPTGVIEFAVLRPAPTFPTFEIRYLLRDLVYMVFFVGLAEELLFRGLLQNDLQAAFGWKWALFGSSAMFAVMHLTWRSIPELFFVFFAALILGGLYLKTKSLVGSIVAHGVNNVMLVAVMPYLIRQ